MDKLPSDPSTFAYLSLLLMHDAMAVRVAVIALPLLLVGTGRVLLGRRKYWNRFATGAWHALSGFYLGLILLPPRLNVFWFDTLWLLLAYAAATVAILNWRDPRNLPV